MREAIEAIQGLLDDPDDLTCEHVLKLQESKRLLEALASPPETVEELERRARELLDDSDIQALEPMPGHVQVWFGADYDLELDVGKHTLRAAWFAIVGMMEVGR